MGDKTHFQTQRKAAKSNCNLSSSLCVERIQQAAPRHLRRKRETEKVAERGPDSHSGNKHSKVRSLRLIEVEVELFFSRKQCSADSLACSPQLCVGFLFLILYPGSLPRLRLPPPPPHLSHTTLSHTIFHIQLCHTPSFTYNIVTHHLSHTTLSHTIFHTQLCHTPSFTHNFVTHHLFTHHLSHNVVAHHLFTHHLSHTHTPSFTYNFVIHHLSHTTLSHTIFHTHHLSHTTLSHTIFHTHKLCHTPSFTHNFVTHHLSHTTLSHTILSHTTLSHTIFHIQLCVAGVALGDIHLDFTWQAWHNLTSTVVLRGRRGTHGPGWRAWARLVASDAAALLRGRRGAW